MENMLTAESVSYFLVFLEGILSFFSPCVLPLIPIYIGYLAGNGKQVDEKGNVIYKRSVVLLNTILFVLGISFAFFILGMSFSALGSFFKEYKDVITKIAGVIIILLGLFQLGILKIKFFQKEHKIHPILEGKKGNPLFAFVLGFTFSFAWTPCVGPALASVLLLASNSSSVWLGNALVLIYALGFIIPFLLLGLFTTRVLNFLKQKQKAFQYTVKVAAVILIIIGIMTLTGWMNGFSSFLTGISQPYQENKDMQTTKEEQNNEKETQKNTNSTDTQTKNNSKEQKLSPAFDFELADQYGKSHKLSDYKGKVVFLNFWATWCPPCRTEMPYIEELYQEYEKNEGDVVIIGVANPKTEKNPYAQDESPKKVKQFLTDNQYTFPVVMDEMGDVFQQYYINSFPTTFMIDKQGNIFGYITGAMDKKTMKSIISQTLEGKRE